MKLRLMALVCALAILPMARAQKNPDVGNVTMDPKKPMVDDLTASPIHTRLVKALQDTRLAATLSSGGPYTVFAPTDDAFNKRGDTALSTLKTGGNATMTRVLQYHVVRGKMTAKQLGKLVKHGKGTGVVKTMEGGTITVKKAGRIFILTDESGRTAVITTPDVKTKNGYFHVIDAVLLPNASGAQQR